MKITIPVNHQFDLCGDEFLQEETFNIIVETEENGLFVNCNINGLENCYILKSNIKTLAKLIE